MADGGMSPTPALDDLGFQKSDSLGPAGVGSTADSGFGAVGLVGTVGFN